MSRGNNVSVEAIDDAKTFDSTKEALAVIGIDGNDRDVLFDILRAIMYLGMASTYPVMNAKYSDRSFLVRCSGLGFSILVC